MKADVKVQVVDGNLVVTLPLINRMSNSGKTVLVATTGGNVKTDVEVNGKKVTVGVNAYIPREENK